MSTAFFFVESQPRSLARRTKLNQQTTTNHRQPRAKPSTHPIKRPSRSQPNANSDYSPRRRRMPGGPSRRSDGRTKRREHEASAVRSGGEPVFRILTACLLTPCSSRLCAQGVQTAAAARRGWDRAPANGGRNCARPTGTGSCDGQQDGTLRGRRGREGQD